MNQKNIVSQHIGSMLCRSDISVTDMLGIQSQFLRYSKWVAKVRGIDMDAEPDRYYRAWTLRGTMHIHEVSDYDLYMHEGNHSPYMKEYSQTSQQVKSLFARNSSEKPCFLRITKPTTFLDQ